MNLKDFKSGTLKQEYQTLYLVSNGLLKKPSLYLSDFIEKNKAAYYEALTTVRTSNDIERWIKFFLEAVISTANSGIETFEGILALKQDMDALIVGFGKKVHNASKLIEFLYQKPIINMADVSEALGISKATTSSLIKDFESKGILKEMTGYERNKLFIFERYLNIYSQG